jgi:hypothetical protein
MGLVPAPEITDQAREHLDGRSVVVRPSRRNGCCGGQATLTIVEIGVPESLDAFRPLEVDEITVYVDRRLDAPGEAWTGDWTLAVDGIRRWRRLVVLNGSVTR